MHLAARNVGVVQLTTSFRALRPIQECVNAAFDPEMQDDAEAGQAAYAPLRRRYARPSKASPASSRCRCRGRMEAREFRKIAIDACLPDAIVAFVEWLVHESGWKVRDPEDPAKLCPLSPRHICLLFRRFTNSGADITRDYVRALEAREIPHLLVGSKSFHSREEVETLRAALTAIEWPEDELSVFATLKGSLFAIPDDLLLRFHHEVGRLHPFRKFPETLAQEFEPIAEALRSTGGTAPRTAIDGRSPTP